MVVLIALITLSSFIVYFTYIQLKILHHTEEPKEKLYVLILTCLYLVCNVYFFYNIDVAYPFDLVLIIAHIIIVSFFWGFHLLYSHIQKDKNRKRFANDGLNLEFQVEKGALFEFLRKFFHFFFFGGLLLYIYLYSYIGQNIQINDPNALAPPSTDGTALSTNLSFDPDNTFPLILEVAVIFLLQIVAPLIIVIEYFRINPRLNNPLQPLFNKSLRKFELTNASNYYYFGIGLFSCGIFLPISCVFGVLCLMGFGDSMASISGKRISDEKRRTIRWETEKCWQASLVGGFFTFITSVLFVGLIMALILGFIFICFDIITPNKLKMSDNLVYPLVCLVIMFIIVVLLEFQISAPLNDLFNEMNKSFFIILNPELK